MNTQGPKKILVVDDEPDLAKVFADTFRANGYEVLTAATGREALEKARYFQPHLITLDILLPDMNGLDLMQSLQKDPATRGVPIVIMSVLDNPPLPSATAKNMPSFQILSKPVDMDRLQGTIQSLLGEHSTKTPLKEMPRVLVADDDEEFAEMLKCFLQDKSFAVQVTTDGRSTIDFIRREQPNLVLLDLMLPDIDGFRVIDTLKKDPTTEKIPILVLTGLKLSGLVDNGSWVRVPRDPQSLTGQKQALLRGIEQKIREWEQSRSKKPRPHVLVADDEADINRIVCDILDQSGFDVISAQNGQEALDIVQREDLDLVLLDVKMPKIDGYEVCRRIKRDPHHETLPVILMTALQEPDVAALSLECGADDRVGKPFVTDELVKKITALIPSRTET